MLGGRGAEIHRCGFHARTAQSVEGSRKSLCLDEGRADDGEGVGGPAAFGAVGSLDQAGAGVQQRRFVAGDVRAGHYPIMLPVPEGHIPGQTGAGNDVQVAFAAQLLVHHHRQLAAGQAVAYRDRVATHKAGSFLPQKTALHPVAQRIGTIQHHQPLPSGSAVLHAVAQGGEEGVIPAAYVGNVVDQRIEQRQGIGGQTFGLLCIQTADSQAGIFVHLVGEHRPGGLVAANTVFRRQQKPQVTAAFQRVKSGFIAAGTPGRAGEQCRAPNKEMGIFRHAVSTKQNHVFSSLMPGNMPGNNATPYCKSECVSCQGD